MQIGGGGLVTGGRTSSILLRLAPLLVAVVVVLARVPLLHLPAWPDEAGFMQVGSHWLSGRGNGSLYAGYWVDRPPLLITVAGLAAQWGGLVALRVVGAVAAAVTVLALADLVRGLTGSDHGALWTALVAGAFLCSPYHWRSPPTVSCWPPRSWPSAWLPRRGL